MAVVFLKGVRVVEAKTVITKDIITLVRHFHQGTFQILLNIG